MTTSKHYRDTRLIMSVAPKIADIVARLVTISELSPLPIALLDVVAQYAVVIDLILPYKVSPDPTYALYVGLARFQGPEILCLPAKTHYIWIDVFAFSSRFPPLLHEKTVYCHHESIINSAGQYEVSHVSQLKYFNTGYEVHQSHDAICVTHLPTNTSHEVRLGTNPQSSYDYCSFEHILYAMDHSYLYVHNLYTKLTQNVPLSWEQTKYPALKSYAPIAGGLITLNGLRGAEVVKNGFYYNRHTNTIHALPEGWFGKDKWGRLDCYCRYIRSYYGHLILVEQNYQRIAITREVVSDPLDVMPTWVTVYEGNMDSAMRIRP